MTIEAGFGCLNAFEKFADPFTEEIPQTDLFLRSMLRSGCIVLNIQDQKERWT